MARYRKHIISYGDTIHNIAQEYTGSVTNWQLITEYNNLKYPYIVSVERKVREPEHFVTYGDEIIIPVEQNILDTNINELGQRDKDLILSLSLGNDLAMTPQSNEINTDHSSEIFSLYSNGKGDIATVSGLENVKQSIINRLLTKKGSHLMHPNYGSDLHTMLGELSTRMRLGMIEDEIERTIRTDGRVSNVRIEDSYIDEDTYYGSFIVELYSTQEYFEMLITGGDNNFVIR